MDIDKIICGDNVEVLRGFPENSIDLTVTSPPYDDLREYNSFSWDFETLAKQLYRVTKDGGVVVWVIGDQTKDGSETGTSFRQALYFIECGFNLHDTMIYDKNGFRFPFHNKYHQVFEYMFILSKGSLATFNPIEDRRAEWSDNHTGGITKREADGSTSFRKGRKADAGRLGKRYNIWRYAGGNQRGDLIARNHPAVFPEALAKDHILSWSNPGDLVLDPFIGSGTTAKMAKELGRHFIGIDISPEYCALAERRIASTNVPLFVEG